MTNRSSDTDNETGGPAAPRDPVTKRSGLYILYESIMEATIRPKGMFSAEINLEGEQLADKARITANVTDEVILELLKSSSGLRRLVHSIGVCVHVQDKEASNVTFTLQNWRNSNKYDSGSRQSISCPTDGSETIMILDEYEWSLYDEAPGQFVFDFGREEVLATASIIFYLHDGYQVPEFVSETPVNFESPSYQEMIARSLLNKGNNKRLKKAIDKAKRGDSVTVAYIGGSITHGAGAVPLHTNCYVYRSFELFKHSFAPDKDNSIRLVKAGLGGTPSELGIVRYERDVLRGGEVEPDIVIVEFAVNDADDETKGNCYESLVLKALAADNKPAVILLFSVFVNDWNLQDRLAPVGWHYNLPMVSIKDAVLEQFQLTKEQGNIISKKQFFYDIYHPTNAGHIVMADCLSLLFTVTDRSDADDEDISIAKPPVIGNDFMDIHLLDRMNNDCIAWIDAGGFGATDRDLQLTEMDDHSYGTPQFPNNWMHKGETGILPFVMKIRSKRLILVFKDSGDPEFGTANIRVDGTLVQVADPLIVNWTHCHALLLYNEQDSGEHTVEIRMAEGHEDKRFTILGFGYVV